MSQDVSPLAGKSAPKAILVDVARLLAAYTELKPDPDVAAQRVAFGTKTALKGLGDFNPASPDTDDTQGSNGGGWSHAGRNLHFGVREHAMGAIVNGVTAATCSVLNALAHPPLRMTCCANTVSPSTT